MRIGVFCPNWVGDGVMALPFLNALRRANPNAAIIIICKSWVAPIFENHPSINGMISFAKKDLTGFRATSNAGRSLKALDLDQFFLLSDSYRAAFLAKKSETKHRIGYPGQGRSPLLTEVILRQNNKMHRSNQYLFLLGGEHHEPFDRGPGITLKRMEIEWAKEELAKIGVSNATALFPFSVASSRSIPQLKVLEILEKIKETILVFGSGGDRKKAEILVEASGRTNVKTVAGHYGLRQSMTLISQCKGAVASDSGLGHISANLSVPTVSLFGAGDASSTGPLGQNTTIINENVHCSPCLKNKCHNKNEPLLCLNEIHSELPWTVLSELSG